MNQETFDKTLLNLSILGTLREQDRLYTRSPGMSGVLDVSGPSKLSFVHRCFYRESRSQNIEDVRTLLGIAFIFLESLQCLKERYSSKMQDEAAGDQVIRQKYQSELRDVAIRSGRLEEALRVAAQGIKRWAATYEGDVQTVSLLKTLLANIEDRLQQA